MAKTSRNREEDPAMVEAPRLFGGSAIDPAGDPAVVPVSGDPPGVPAGAFAGAPAICS